MLLPPRPPTPRRGLSLLEVLVALAIFLLSFVAIGRLVTLASDHAIDLQQQSMATRMAQSKLNEVLCGALGLSSAEGSFDEDPGWQWSIDAEQDSSGNGLWTVTATVKRQGSDPEVSASVSQMVLDPSLRGSVFDQVTVTGSTDTAPANGGTTSPQGSSGSGGGATGGGATAGGAGGGATRGGGTTRGGMTTPGRGPTTTPGRGPTGPTTPTTPGRGPTGPTPPVTPRGPGKTG